MINKLKQDNFRTNNKGILCAIGSNILWGILPIYWKFLNHVPASQIVCHRIIWSYLVLLLIILLQQNWKDFFLTAKKPKILFVYSIAATLVTINWFVYIWAVNAGFVIAASLGYFISPLASVLMGVIFLREKLRSYQWFALGLVGVAIIYLAFFYSQGIWISMILALSFSSYGLIKKLAPLNALYSLTLETAIMFIPATILLFYLETINSTSTFYNYSITTDILLIGTGLATTIPLLLFSAAVRYTNLSLVGFLQYMLPTLQFLIGRFIFNEYFTQGQLFGFIIMWVALAIFIVGGVIIYCKNSYKNKK